MPDLPNFVYPRFFRDRGKILIILLYGHFTPFRKKNQQKLGNANRDLIHWYIQTKLVNVLTGLFKRYSKKKKQTLKCKSRSTFQESLCYKTPLNPLDCKIWSTWQILLKSRYGHFAHNGPPLLWKPRSRNSASLQPSPQIGDHLI